MSTQLHSLIAGVDEAGRGALAGPVVAGAVILPLHDQAAMAQLRPINDSKQLSAKKRDTFYDLLVAHAAAWAVGESSAAEIDEIGILPATRQAMRRALSKLDITPKALLIDGRIKLPQVDINQKSIIRGDSLSLSIAAGSILAKVTRDRIMIDEAAVRFPVYRFEQHKGYGTLDHREAIAEYGPCEIHRHTFAPIRQD